MFRDITPHIIGAAIKVHRRLGPGLLESAYESCLAYEKDGIKRMVNHYQDVPVDDIEEEFNNLTAEAAKNHPREG